jgi:Holliday junction resolvase-like predicted endonuclease
MNNSRAPKLLGDFGEGLITYLLIRKGFEVAYVDHVGADLIAERNGERWAVSVKLRLFKAGTAESRMVAVENYNLEKLKHFAERFAMQPAFAQVICEVDTKIIHAFLFRTASLGTVLPPIKSGYSLRFGPKHLSNLIEHHLVDYSSWQEGLAASWFGT